MPFVSHTNSSPNALQRFRAIAALVTSLALLTSCGSRTSAEIDVTAEGQNAYACALADHVEAEHGSPESWVNFIGDDADPGAREVSSIGALAMGAENAAFRDIGEQLMEGISRVDIGALNDGLAVMHDACDGVAGVAHADVSHNGQLEYACTLTDWITEERSDASSWVSDDNATAWYEAVGASALTGAMNGQLLADHEALSDAGRHLLSALNRLDADHIDESLDEFQSACPDL